MAPLHVGPLTDLKKGELMDIDSGKCFKDQSVSKIKYGSTSSGSTAGELVVSVSGIMGVHV